MKLSSHAFLDSVALSEPQLALDVLYQHAEGLLVLTGGPHGLVGRLLAEGQGDAAEAALLELKKHFDGHLYVELQRHNLPLENKVEPGLIDLAYKHDIPLVATNDVFFSDEGMFRAHDALLCISQGVVVETNRHKVTPDHRFKTAAEMQDIYARSAGSSR